jgi:hypothetical protein
MYRLPLSIVLQSIEILQLLIYDIVTRKRIVNLKRSFTVPQQGNLLEQNSHVIESIKKIFINPISLYPMFR